MRIFLMISTESSVSFTKLALDSFFANTDLANEDKFILIDNDGSLPSDIVSDRRLIILNNPKSKSFAANVNQGLRMALREKANLFLLNNDLVFTENWCRYLEESKLEISSPLSNVKCNMIYRL